MKDIKGLKFGKLLALEYLGNSKWLCKCECGNFAEVNSNKLRSGHTRSCGCITKTKKGESHTRLCQIYRAMKNRCYSPKNNRYKYYGAKGIKVCSKWLNDFQAFKKWAIQNGYSDSLTIDRISTSADYTPSNCRWVNYTTQNRNRKTTLKYTFKGVEKTLFEWANTLGIEYKTLYTRLKILNWSIEKAFNTPKRSNFINAKNK